MKKLLITTLSFMTLFTIFGEKCALASNSNNKSNKSHKEKMYTYNSRGVRTGSYAVYYQENKVRRVDSYDTRGVRKNVSKVR